MTLVHDLAAFQAPAGITPGRYGARLPGELLCPALSAVLPFRTGQDRTTWQQCELTRFGAWPADCVYGNELQMVLVTYRARPGVPGASGGRAAWAVPLVCRHLSAQHCAVADGVMCLLGDVMRSTAMFPGDVPARRRGGPHDVTR